MDATQSKAEVMHMEQDKGTPRDVTDKVDEARVLERENGTSALKLDKHGLPLVPQPTERKDDPLVCMAVAKLAGARSCYSHTDQV
jgi:hypothetical protein